MDHNTFILKTTALQVVDPLNAGEISNVLQASILGKGQVILMVMCRPQPRFLFPGIFSQKSMFYALKIKCENGQNYKVSL